MPLKLKLAANERLVVNGAVLVNGAVRSSLLICNFAHIIREADVLHEADADTPTKRLYFLVQAMLMAPPPDEQLMAKYRRVLEQLADAFVKPDNLAVLAEVDRLVGSGDFYKALTKLQPLIAYEAQLLNVPAHEWKRANRPISASRLERQDLPA